MLEVAGLRAGYGPIPVLHGCSFTIRKGEFVGILGHNGMGKTTLMRTVMGYLRAIGGWIRYEGEDITTLPTHQRARRGISLVPQGREIFPTCPPGTICAWACSDGDAPKPPSSTG